MSERDWQIVEFVNQLHLLTGGQIERLSFHQLAGRSRVVTRSRALARLSSWRVVHPLPRRVGGAQRGSTVGIFSLGVVGQRLLVMRAANAGRTVPVREPRTPSDRFIAHLLAVSELAVQLREAERAGGLLLRQFITEPRAWWPNGQGGWIKPDAFVVTSNGHVDQLWWLEVDRATESLSTIGRKLRVYLEFVHRGELGPRQAIPRVLITVPHDRRLAAIQRLIKQLPKPASELFVLAIDRDAQLALLCSLKE
jgi:hypothetical protein